MPRPLGASARAGRGDRTRAVNATMTVAYWLVGRRIVEEEPRGAPRAGYGEVRIEQRAR